MDPRGPTSPWPWDSAQTEASTRLLPRFELFFSLFFFRFSSCSSLDDFSDPLTLLLLFVSGLPFFSSTTTPLPSHPLQLTTLITPSSDEAVLTMLVGPTSKIDA